MANAEWQSEHISQKYSTEKNSMGHKQIQKICQVCMKLTPELTKTTEVFNKN
jgi:hypothetical protein